MPRTKVTVTIDDALVRELDRYARTNRESRSRIVEQAIRNWHLRQVEQELIEGYRAMAEEDVATAEARLDAGVEAFQ